jgi:hypothetical protein
MPLAELSSVLLKGIVKHRTLARFKKDRANEHLPNS